MSKHDRVLLAHGSGGVLGSELVKGFAKAFSNPYLDPLNDQAILPAPPSGSRLAFTTDSYVINPLFFSGGDIGKLSVCGTVNDLAMGGAKPLYMTAAFIIEEGFLFADLDKIVASMATAAKSSGVLIVAGDTKVVEKGKGDGIFINTSGIGVVADGVEMTPLNIKEGDKVIVSGTVGDHGTAVLLARGNFNIKADIKSDCALLHELSADIIIAGRGAVRTMRDPTRGGLATILNELVDNTSFGMVVREADIPVKDGVRGACELLGFEPIYLANEGKLVCIVAPDVAADVLDVMCANPLGKDSIIIGEVIKEPTGRVLLETTIGGRRILDKLSGQLLPRIC
jgi:hydrogenase expression/formation protein HypE